MPREVLGDLLRALGQNPTQAEGADIVASAPREGAWFGLSLTAAEAYQWYGGIGGHYMVELVWTGHAGLGYWMDRLGSRLQDLPHGPQQARRFQTCGYTRYVCDASLCP